MNDYDTLESDTATAIPPLLLRDADSPPGMPAPGGRPGIRDADHAGDAHATAPAEAPEGDGAPPAADASPDEAAAASPARPPGSCDPLLASLGRHFRGVVVRLDLELYTPVVQQVFRRDFAYLSRQLHALESSRRVADIDTALLDEALVAVADRSRLACETLAALASETRTLVALSGYADAALDFGRSLRVPATIVSPHAHAFLEMLARADELQSHTEMAWLLGLLDAETRARRTWTCRNELTEFKEFVRRQRHVVGEHVRQVNAARKILARSLPPRHGGRPRP